MYNVYIYNIFKVRLTEISLACLVNLFYETAPPVTFYHKHTFYFFSPVVILILYENSYFLYIYN